VEALAPFRGAIASVEPSEELVEMARERLGAEWRAATDPPPVER
jgi:hypothetical protein